MIKKTLLTVLTAAAVGLGYQQYTAPEDQLLYVFEIVRHGARAPMAQAQGFSVAKGMLTPMGMR